MRKFLTLSLLLMLSVSAFAQQHSVKGTVTDQNGRRGEGRNETTVGGRFRYDYISAKYFAQNAWGNEAGKIFGTATKVQIEGNCAAFFVRTPI